MAILISTPQELDNIRNNLTADYELTNDIDMSGYNWTPISYYDNATWVNGFTGNFNGKGYKIKNLTINKSTGIYLGLFGQAFYGTIQNVGLENVTINGSQCRFIGALVGYAYSLTVKNCYVSGGNITAQDESGGLLGKVDTCTIENSYSQIPITLNTDYYGGGFVGSVDSNTSVKNSYSTGRVTYSGTSSWNGKSGFAGFVRNNANVVFENCFFDKESSGQSGATSEGSPPNVAVSGVIGKTTAEMKQQSTYVGYDFTNTWTINNDYPTLKVFGVSLVAKIESRNIISYTLPINSIINRKAKTLKELSTYASAILSHTERHTATFRNVEGHLSPINSNVTQIHRSVRTGNRNIDSFTLSIGSNIYRESKTIQQLLSYMEPVQVNVSVLYPIRDIPIYAYSEVIQNPSSVSEVANLSEVRMIQNPSEVEVI